MSNIFEGIQFNLPIGISERKKYMDLIMEHGGIVTSEISDEIIILHENKEDLTKIDKNQLIIQFINDCIKEKKFIENHENYMKDINQNQNGERSLKKRRFHYTEEEDSIILNFVKNYEETDCEYGSVHSMNFWKYAETIKLTKHSAYSMHDHYRKKLEYLSDLEKIEMIENHFKNEKQSNGFETPKQKDNTISLFNNAMKKSPNQIRLENEEKSKLIEEKYNNISNNNFDNGPFSNGNRENGQYNNNIEEIENVENIEELKKIKMKFVLDQYNKEDLNEKEEYIDKLFNYIMSSTGHTKEVIAHAFYYSTCNIETCIQFLRSGNINENFWYEEEDEILEQYRNGNLDEALEALENGTMLKKLPRHSKENIIERIQFLAN